MLNKIKEYAGYVFAGVIAILGALLYRQNKKTDQVESDLAGAIAKNKVQEVDHDREIAKQNADALVNDYERRKSEYESGK